jgi:CRISPR-associated endonuclease/helicase Cas3
MNMYAYWGKAGQSKREGNFLYHPAVYHCLDVAAVIWQELEPETTRCLTLASRCGLSPQLIRYLCTLAFMFHDLGKFTKSFQSLRRDLFRILFPESRERPYVMRHDTMGYAIWLGSLGKKPAGIFRYIEERNPIVARLLSYFIEASFGHHGIPPKESLAGGGQALPVRTYYDDDDVAAVISFVDACLSLLGEPPDLPREAKPFRESLRGVSWSIAGLGIAADWIGSNTNYFEYCASAIPLDAYWHNCALPKAEEALEAIGWKSHRSKSFSSIGAIFPKITEPTPLQATAATLPLLDGPQLFFLEDVTGAGKTEAAIVLASRLMASGAADGLYIGLPTMATANAMYERMQDAYLRLYEAGEYPSLILSHGARHLSEKFTETVLAHDQGSDMHYGEEEETASAICAEWYADNRKKALLADIGVGTLDQALIGVLANRHQAMRLLGLERKVLIVDEVHAYDPYMKYLLGTLLRAHASTGGSAILLSATIPKQRRKELAGYFLDGLSLCEEDCDHLALLSKNGFPMLTQIAAFDVRAYPIDTRKDLRRTTAVSFFYVYEDVLDFIEKKSAKGECVCWIRNTVKGARQVYADLRRRGKIPDERLSLFHSRFAMIDRARIEGATIENFGPKSSAKDRNGRVLIATQVVEQSLDLDFDELVTDLAPIDLIIQRGGRLHRHVRNLCRVKIPDLGAADERQAPVLHIFAPPFDAEAKESWLLDDFSGTASVYHDAGKLWRTEKYLLDHKQWTMPDDAEAMIESVYSEIDEEYQIPDGLCKRSDKAMSEDFAKESMGHLNALNLDVGYCQAASTIGEWDEEHAALSRLSEENTEVILVVAEGEALKPYAESERYEWDWSAMNIPAYEWKKAGYALPEEYQPIAGALQEHNMRLRYAQFVIVDRRSRAALDSRDPISSIYDPRLGWGADPLLEEV